MDDAVKITDFSFTYPGGAAPALSHVNCRIRQGELVLLFGESGSGKTTLLSCLKREIEPKGERSGTIRLLSDAGGCYIGFVSQNPDNQAVAQTVRKELAFGMENAGADVQTVSRKIAEIACYFGIEDLLDRKISELSGGQKQLCSLCAALCLDPRILLLDEPVSRLDPVAAEKLLQELRRVNRETGITVIISEHRTEGILPLCDRAVFLQKGQVLFDGGGQDFASFVLNRFPELSDALPQSALLAYRAGKRENLPMSVNEGRQFLQSLAGPPIVCPVAEKEPGTPLLTAEDLWFSYGKKNEPVLLGADFCLDRGEIHAVTGGNGAGKSTLFYLLAGCMKPAKGKIKKEKGCKTAYLPQNPELLFVCQNLFSDLMELSGRFGYSEEDAREWMRRLGIAHLAERHPYDLSGGEKQRAALAKLFLTKPDVLLLDEPTSGLDSAAKQHLREILLAFAANGGAAAMITHDLPFAAGCADTVSMLSRGKAVCRETMGEFLRVNRYFTTPCRRMTSFLPREAVRPDEVMFDG